MLQDVRLFSGQAGIGDLARVCNAQNADAEMRAK